MKIKTKKCCRCKKIKDIKRFSFCLKLISGRLGTCKDCRNEGMRKYRQTEIGAIKQKESNRRYLSSEKGKKAIKRYQQSEKGREAMKRANMKRNMEIL